MRGLGHHAYSQVIKRSGLSHRKLDTEVVG